MNIKQFAEMLNGREYRSEITKDEIKLAKELGFVVVYGASDDLIEFEGAISDEGDCYDGGNIYIDKNGIFEECECNCKFSQDAKKQAKVIEIIWGKGEYSWQYETDIPHETFDIYEDGEKFCKGIVFDIKSLEGNNERYTNTKRLRNILKQSQKFNGAIQYPLCKSRRI